MEAPGKSLRVLMVGDVVGPSGRAAIELFVPKLREELALDAVVVNGENSADSGLGVTPTTAEHILRFADFVTLGDHAHDQPEIGPTLDSDSRIIRPANMDPALPGRGWGTFTVGETRVGVVNLMGRVFMKATPESPFAAADRAISALSQDGIHIILVDFQAEATSEAQAMGWYLDGRVSAVLGTHTHVPTADLRIFPGGTAYISDIGMTGAKHSIIGFEPSGWARVFGFEVPASKDTGAQSETAQTPRGNFPADRPAKLEAVLLVIDPTTGLALRAEQVLREE